MIKVREGSKNQAVFRQISGLDRNFFKGVRLAFWQIGKRLVQTASQGILREPKSGRVYKHKNKMIRASAPGQYPANRSGTLRRSIDFKVIGSKRMIFGASADYAKFVHDGTSRMGSRPFLRKADAAVFKFVDREVDTAFSKKVNYRV